MKRKLIIGVLIIIFTESYAQNLVPNFDFEDTIACPNGAGALFYASPWVSFSETPDYLNSCAPSCLQPSICYGIPNNWFGSQLAYSGNGYAGIITYSFDFADAREIMGVPLISPLEIGKKYFLSWYVSRAGGIQSRGATNNIGCRFSTVPFDGSNPMLINNTSHYRDTLMILDTLGWTRISGRFTADSTYQYLAIGNFYDDSNTDTIDMDPMGQPWNYAYYFVDNVCVTPDSTNCNPINWVRSDFKNDIVVAFPNPFTENLQIKTNVLGECKVIIYDTFKRKRIIKTFQNMCDLQTSELNQGVYFYSIYKDDIFIKSGKLIKN